MRVATPRPFLPRTFGPSYRPIQMVYVENRSENENRIEEIIALKSRYGMGAKTSPQDAAKAKAMGKETETET